MDFRVLGPMEVHGEDGASVRVPGRIHPRMLAALLLEPGHAMSTGYLTEVVWDGDAPVTAATQLRNAVPVLRKVVGDRLGNSRGQFSLRVADAELDVRRFERALARARDLRHDGNLREAVRELLIGVDTWRGRVLPGMIGRYFEQAAARLEAARLAAVEDRIELELELGESEGTVAELRQLLVEYPHRQRLVGQLMLALYRDGHTAEALELYQESHDRLSEELGVDPGPALRDLHVAILREDPKLLPVVPAPDSAESRSAPATIPVPAQLPVDTTGFVGRRDELDTLDALVRDGAGTVVVSAIDGTGGAGKTALAVHWAHRHRDAFPDGQLYINLRGFDQDQPLTPQEALERFLNALGLTGSAIPSDTDAAAALYRSMLADKRMLIVLDNARDIAQVRPLLAGSAGCLTIVTSRSSLAALTALYNTKSIPLGILEHGEAVTLLSDVVGARRLAAEPEATGRLARLCAGLPLALRIAAANLSFRPNIGVADFVGELEAADRLDKLVVYGAPEVAVTATLDHSFEALDSEAQRLFQMLGLIPGEDFGVELAAACAESNDKRTLELLNRLESAHLLEQQRPGRYRFHDLIRLYAGRRAHQNFAEDTRSALVGRFIAWFNGRADAMIADEDVNVLRACEALDEHPKLWQLANALNNLTRGGNTLIRAQRIFERALALAEANGDRNGSYRMTVRLIPCHRFNGELDKGLERGRQAVALAEGLNARQLGVAKANLGLMHYGLGEFQAAEPLLRDAFDISAAGGELRNQQIGALNLGALYRELGRFHDAEEYLRRAANLSVKLPPTGTVILIHAARIGVNVDSGRFDEARALLEQVPRIPKAEFSVRAECLLSCARGELSHATADLLDAGEHFRHMFSMATEHGFDHLAAESTFKLSIVLAELGRATEARSRLDGWSDQDVHDLGPQIVAGFALARGAVHCAASEFEEALRQATIAVDRYGAMPNPRQHARSLLVAIEARTGLERTKH